MGSSQYLTTRDALTHIAKLTGHSFQRSKLDRLIASGELPHTKVPRSNRNQFLKSDIERLFGSSDVDRLVGETLAYSRKRLSNKHNSKNIRNQKNGRDSE